MCRYWTHKEIGDNHTRYKLKLRVKICYHKARRKLSTLVRHFAVPGTQFAKYKFPILAMEMTQSQCNYKIHARGIFEQYVKIHEKKHKKLSMPKISLTGHEVVNLTGPGYNSLNTLASNLLPLSRVAAALCLS